MISLEDHAITTIFAKSDNVAFRVSTSDPAFSFTSFADEVQDISVTLIILAHRFFIASQTIFNKSHVHFHANLLSRQDAFHDNVRKNLL